MNKEERLSTIIQDLLAFSKEIELQPQEKVQKMEIAPKPQKQLEKITSNLDFKKRNKKR
jgi:hypothetical protein